MLIVQLLLHGAAAIWCLACTFDIECERSRDAISTGGSGMTTRQFTVEEAREIGRRVGIDWEAGDVDFDQFQMGLAVELEHGSQDPSTNVTHEDPGHHGKDRPGASEGDPRLLHAPDRDGARCRTVTPRGRPRGGPVPHGSRPETGELTEVAKEQGPGSAGAKRSSRPS